MVFDRLRRVMEAAQTEQDLGFWRGISSYPAAPERF